MILAQQLPSQFVADRVRDVLQNHESSVAWKSLADALPQLALKEGADLKSTFDAARLAEEMGAPVLSAEPTGSFMWLADVPWPSYAVMEVAIPTVVAIVSFFVLLTVVRRTLGGSYSSSLLPSASWPTLRMPRWSIPRLRLPNMAAPAFATARPALRPAPTPAARFSTTAVGNRFRQANDLAAHGASIEEIARRTGMARDAIAVMLGMRGR